MLTNPPEAAGERLPAVLYNGAEPWTATEDMRSLIATVGRAVPYQPQLIFPVGRSEVLTWNLIDSHRRNLLGGMHDPNPRPD